MTEPGSAGGLFGGLFARGQAPAELTDRAIVQAMLDVEVALLRALARTGMAPDQAAEELASIADAGAFDLEQLGRCSGEKGTPVPALVSALRERVTAETAAHIHRGATSQDILDTALMLVSRRALTPTIADLEAAAAAAASLADRHRHTVLAGRTLLQQALPMPFGLKAALWLSGLDASRGELAAARASLAAQVGGAVGTLAAFGERGLDVAALMAGELGLEVPELPWHTLRMRPIRLAAALGAATGLMGKIARDVVLLAQTEIGEAAESGPAGRGGSSTMPHKRNPVGAIAVTASAARVPGLVATMFSSIVQEHERGAGGWQSEWETLLELLRLTGSAASSTGELLSGLEVDAERMLANLDPLLMSESIAAALAPSLGWQEAQRLVTQAASSAAGSRLPFRDVLLESDLLRRTLGERGLDEALDPHRYLGASDQLIDRALAAHGQASRSTPG